MLLQAIRGKAATWIVKILFILLIISFGAWGITDYIRRSSRPTAVATIGSAEIRPTELNAAIERESERLRAYFGKLDREQMRQLALADQALDRMVTRALIEQEAGRLGIRITDATVRQAIQSVKAFHNEVGQFDRGKFANLISRLGYNEDRFIAETRRDLTRDQLVGVIAGGVHPPAALVETLARYRYEKRIAATLSIGFDSIDTPPDPNAETLASFHDANASRFMTPELRKVSYLLLSAQNLLSNMSVSEDDIKAAYENRLGEFTQPESREVDQLLFADEAAAKQAAARIAKGASVHDAGGVYSDLGPVVSGDLPPLFGDVVFSLPAGTVSAPVHSDFGWHLFIARGIRAGSQTPFEEARAPLRDALLRDKALDRTFELSNRIDEKLAGGASLEEIAAENGLSVHSAGPLDQTGRLANGEGASDFPASVQVLAAAFGLSSGENTRLLEIQQPFEGFIALRLDAVTPATPKSLAAAKDEILAAWREDQRAGLAQKRGEALAERLRKGETVEAVAKSAGLAVRATQPFTRDGRSGDIPAALIADLFSASLESVAHGRGTGVYVVAQLTRILPFDPVQEAETLRTLSKNLGEALAVDIFGQFTQTLKERFPVVINRDLLQKFY